jgi:hypothetical protein
LNWRRAPGPAFCGLRGGLRQIEILSAFCELSRLCGKENFRLGRATAAAPSWPVTADDLDQGIDRQIGPARLSRPAGRKRIDLKTIQLISFSERHIGQNHFSCSSWEVDQTTYNLRVIDCVFTRTFLPQLHADLPLRDAIKASQMKSRARGSRRPRSAPGLLRRDAGRGLSLGRLQDFRRRRTRGRRPPWSSGTRNTSPPASFRMRRRFHFCRLDQDRLQDDSEKDVTRQDFGTALKEFSRESSKADMTLFIFSGHHLQVSSKNYSMPIDAEDIDHDSISIDQSIMSSKRQIRRATTSKHNNPQQSTDKK